MADHIHNRFLDSLSPDNRNRLVAASTAIALPLHTPLAHANESARYAYFLTSGIASIVMQTLDGEAAEVGGSGPGERDRQSPASRESTAFDQLHDATGRVGSAHGDE